MTETHAPFMRRALDLAQKGKGFVSPNPCVGSVFVKNNRIVGEGYHRFYGAPHAEIDALRNAKTNLKGATLYVTLEPCAHWGKTPPCAPRLAQLGLKDVYVAMRDPFPPVNGRGLAILRRAGVRVHVGLGATEAKALNRPFLTYVAKKRPFVTLKMAMTLDGRIATASGQSRWITGAPARELVHRWRAETDAVLIGAGTALADDPALTSHGAGRNPLRLVLDPSLRTPPSARLLRDKSAAVYFIAASSASAAREQALVRRGATVLRFPLRKKTFHLAAVLRRLGEIPVGQLLVEGGGETAWRFLSAGLVDELRLFAAPVVVGGRAAKSWVEGNGVKSLKSAYRLKEQTVQRIGDDLLIRGFFDAR